MTFITTNKLRIFLVEDNADLREEMIFGLTSLGIEAFGFGDAQSLYRELAARECDVLVIDVGLPGEDGFSIAEHLSGNLSRGIILLTEELSWRIVCVALSWARMPILLSQLM